MAKTKAGAAPDIAVMEVKNPDARLPGRIVRDPLKHDLHYKPNPEEFVFVARAVRNDPLGALHNRGQIGEAQYRAGREMQGHYETMFGSIRGIDHTRDKVDGGKLVPTGLAEKVTEAVKRVHELEAALGDEDTALMRAVLVSGLMPHEHAVRQGYTKEKDIRSMTWAFCRALSVLATKMGHALPT